MDRQVSDEYAIALAMQDQSRAAAMDWLRTSRQFALSALTEEGDGGTIISVLGDAAECASFIFASLVAYWDALHQVTGETDAELFARLMAGLAGTRQNNND